MTAPRPATEHENPQRDPPSDPVDELPSVSVTRPRWRGVSHLLAFIGFLPACVWLFGQAADARQQLAAVIYAIGLCGALGVSAFYHRAPLGPVARRWMRRLDHSMIFVFIAGTYTPFGMLALTGTVGTGVLIAVWGGGVAGIISKLLWIDAPDWVSSTLYVVVGSSMIVALPDLIDAIGALGTGLVGLGGVFYIIGAVVFATQRPDPAPRVFGFHEVFHLLVVAAAVLHFVAIAGWVIG